MILSYFSISGDLIRGESIRTDTPQKKWLAVWRPAKMIRNFFVQKNLLFLKSDEISLFFQKDAPLKQLAYPTRQKIVAQNFIKKQFHQKNKQTQRLDRKKHNQNRVFVFFFKIMFTVGLSRSCVSTHAIVISSAPRSPYIIHSVQSKCNDHFFKTRHVYIVCNGMRQTYQAIKHDEIANCIANKAQNKSTFPHQHSRRLFQISLNFSNQPIRSKYVVNFVH